MDAPPGIFRGNLDRFNGVTIESQAEFNGSENFSDKLQSKSNIKCVTKYICLAMSQFTSHQLTFSIKLNSNKNKVIDDKCMYGR